MRRMAGLVVAPAASRWRKRPRQRSADIPVSIRSIICLPISGMGGIAGTGRPPSWMIGLTEGDAHEPSRQRALLELLNVDEVKPLSKPLHRALVEEVHHKAAELVEVLAAVQALAVVGVLGRARRVDV